MISQKNKHLTVKVQQPVYDYIMKFSKLYNVSASGICNYLIQNGILELDKQEEAHSGFFTYISKYIKQYDLRRK